MYFVLLLLMSCVGSLRMTTTTGTVLDSTMESGLTMRMNIGDGANSIPAIRQVIATTTLITRFPTLMKAEKGIKVAEDMEEAIQAEADISNRFLFWLFLLPAILSGHVYQLSVGMIFKNEAEWLAEFIDYHRKMGVEHFYFYNNGSQDNYLEVLAPYMKSGIVELIDWIPGVAPWKDPSSVSKTHWVGYQLSAYEDCIKRSVGVSKWLAIIDADEFIVPVHGKETFDRLLAEAKPTLGCIQLHWRCFGTSEVWEIPPQKLLKTLTRRAADVSKAPHCLSKCIYRPEAVEVCMIHHGNLLPSYETVEMPAEEIRLNHYQFRGRKNYIEKRWYGYGLREKKVTFFDLFNRDLATALRKVETRYNSVKDTTVLQYLE